MSAPRPELGEVCTTPPPIAAVVEVASVLLVERTGVAADRR